MTLEEKAEEYLLNNFDPTEETTENDVKKAYIAGATFAIQYMTANATYDALKLQWHFVKDGDLPEPFILVLGYFNIVDGTPWNSNFVACQYGNGNWYDDCMTYIEQDREPIAWCELPPVPIER